MGEPLRQAVESSLRPYVMEVFRPGLKVALATLGQTVVPVGGLLAAGQLISPCP